MKLLVLGGVLACLLGSGYGEHFKDVKKKLTRQCGRGPRFHKMHKKIAPRILQAINVKNNDVASGAFIDLKLEVERVCRAQNKKRVLKMIENSINYHKLNDDVIGGPAQVAMSPGAGEMPKGSVPKCGYRNVYGQSAKKEEKATKTNLYDPSKPKRFINSNIVGGNDTEIGEFPWQVSFRDPREKTNFCGGSIIDEYTILSAAHCFVNIPKDKSNGKLRFGGKRYEWTRTQFKVAVGWSKSMGAKKDVDDDDAKFGTSVYPIDLRQNKEKGKVIIHKDYHHGQNSNGIANANDIAIVRLHKPIVFPEASDYGVPNSGQPAGAGNIQKGTFVRPVCFPSSNTPGPRLLTKWGLHNIPKARKNVAEEVPSYLIITGYGNTDAGTLHGTGQEKNLEKKTNWKIASDRLLKANIYGMDNNKCQAKLTKSGKGIKISEKQVCAQHLAIGGEVVDTCQGDSGGPIVYAYQKCKLPGMTKAQINKCIEKSHGHNDKWDQHILYGVTSYGFGCGEYKTPGMYTRVTEYMDWITENGARPQYADLLN